MDILAGIPNSKLEEKFPAKPYGILEETFKVRI
jgi:hypothetical protein